MVHCLLYILSLFSVFFLLPFLPFFFWGQSLGHLWSTILGETSYLSLSPSSVYPPIPLPSYTSFLIILLSTFISPYSTNPTTLRYFFHFAINSPFLVFLVLQVLHNKHINLKVWSKIHRWMRTRVICLSGSGLPHSVKCFSDPFTCNFHLSL